MQATGRSGSALNSCWLTSINSYAKEVSRPATKVSLFADFNLSTATRSRMGFTRPRLNQYCATSSSASLCQGVSTPPWFIFSPSHQQSVTARTVGHIFVFLEQRKALILASSYYTQHHRPSLLIQHHHVLPRFPLWNKSPWSVRRRKSRAVSALQLRTKRWVSRQKPSLFPVQGAPEQPGNLRDERRVSRGCYKRKIMQLFG